MTEPIAFDTHKFVKHLTENGFTEQQAEVLADEQVHLLNSNLATKADIEALQQATKADIEALQQATKADIKALQQATKADIKALQQATKADIKALRQTTKAEIEALKQETKAGIEMLKQTTKTEIQAAKTELLKWFFGALFSALFAQAGLIVALIKLL